MDSSLRVKGQEEVARKSVSVTRFFPQLDLYFVLLVKFFLYINVDYLRFNIYVYKYMCHGVQ